MPTPTSGLALHELALEIGLAVDYSTYDTLYVAFAIAVGAQHVVHRHPDPALAGMLLPRPEWARDHGLA